MLYSKPRVVDLSRYKDFRFDGCQNIRSTFIHKDVYFYFENAVKTHEEMLEKSTKLTSLRHVK